MDRPVVGAALKQRFWNLLNTNDTAELGPLLAAQHELLQCDFGHNNTAIKAAAYLSNTETVQLLLESGARPDDRISDDDAHWTALHKAVVDGNCELVALLIEHGADPRLTWNGQTALDLAKDLATRSLLEDALASMEPAIRNVEASAGDAVGQTSAPPEFTSASPPPNVDVGDESELEGVYFPLPDGPVQVESTTGQDDVSE